MNATMEKELFEILDENDHYKRYNAYRMWGLGIFLLEAVMLIGLSISDVAGGFNGDSLTFTLVAHLLNCILGISMIIYGRYKRRFKVKLSSLPLQAILLACFSMGAYLLNLELPVFGKFVPWSQTLIILVHVALVAIAFTDKLPNFLFKPLLFLSGIGFTFVSFQFLFSLPATAYGLLGMIVFGIGIYIFVPLMSVILFIKFARKFQPARSNYFLAGISAALLCSFLFVLQWRAVANELYDAKVYSYTHSTNELPRWVLLSQNWSGSYLAEKIIDGDSNYQKFDFNNYIDHIFSGQRKEHDPLIFLASFVGPTIDLTRNERQQILDSKFDARHESYSKLWSDTNLSTDKVITHMQVFPDYRLGYLEKTITIKNSASHKSNQQEALYSFHLPAGSVATSLSLWVNGVEEKSRLTTKKKASQAYNTIVGRERRDPALLHWQEGNRITVTVFPCTPAEAREFKIGFTIPLEEKGDQLILKNVFFEGPDINSAEETTVIKFESEHDFEYVLPRGFAAQSTKEVKKSGNYSPYWELAITKTPLSNDQFVFEGNEYNIEPLVFQPNNQSIDAYYLDINSTWTRSELNGVFELLDGKEVYVWNQGFFKVDNKKDPSIKNVLRKKEFTLFPIHNIPSKHQPVIISKSIFNSPNLGDLKNSKFESSLMAYMEKEPQVMDIFYLDDALSPYWASLQEMQLVNVIQGDLDQLRPIVEQGKFPKAKLGKDEVAIPQSGIKISSSKTISTAKSNAPDHLMRLHSYNSIMQSMKGAFFNAKDYEQGPLIDMAELAHVASPVSSMIVLETIKDYERFDIKKKSNGLKNAAVNSSGSVPEPHEWALIFLGLFIMLYLKFKG